jgi:hypothetical protein
MRLGDCLLPLLLLVVAATAQQFDLEDYPDYTGSGEEADYGDEGTGAGEDASDSEEGSSGEGSGSGEEVATEVTVIQSATFSMPAVGATTISLRLDQVQGKEDTLQLVCL